MRRLALIAIGLAACSKRAPAPDDNPSSWSTAPIGSVYETKTITRMEKPFARQSVTTTRQTLLARNDSEASVRLEMSEGVATSTQVVTVPLRKPHSIAAHDGTIETMAADTCRVGAGTFACTRATIEIHQGDARRSSITWTAPQIPVPLRSVVTNENMTVTTELVSVH